MFRRRSVRKPWKFMFSITPLSFDALLQGTPANIRINLILPETAVIGLHLWCWKCRSIFIQIFMMGSERRTCFETDSIMALQGHPRSLILAPMESAYATFYWSAIVTFVLPCPVSAILTKHFIQTKVLKAYLKWHVLALNSSHQIQSLRIQLEIFDRLSPMKPQTVRYTSFPTRILIQ